MPRGICNMLSNEGKSEVRVCDTKLGSETHTQVSGRRLGSVLRILSKRAIGGSWKAYRLGLVNRDPSQTEGT